MNSTSFSNRAGCCMPFFSLDNLSIKTRMWASFGLVLVLLAITIVLSVASGRSAKVDLEKIVDMEMHKLDLVSQIDSATKSNARNTLELFVAKPEAVPAIRERMAKTRTEIDRLMEELTPMLVLPKGQALLADIKQARSGFVTAFTLATQQLDSGNQAAATEIVNSRVLPAVDALAKPIDELLGLQKKLAQERGANAGAAIDRQNTLNAGLGLFALLVGVVAALSMVKSIMRPLNQAMDVASKIAQGDLTVPIHVHGKNELSLLLESMHQMQESLSHVMMRIQESAAQVANASAEIATANMDLSSRTEAQASSLEETAASMEEMTSTVHQNMQITQVANNLASEASLNAREVGGLVDNVVSTMRDIHSSSQRIRDIISVIDSIAFQTNILALNAAVEAARAGEQGRGFAVVASEVRSLAQRSASAAQEIKTIIQDNVAKMDMGNEVALKAGESVGQVVSAIENVNQTVSEVASTTREQTSGIEQVSQAMAQLDQATQQNAALVEETAAASKNLDDQVQSLKNAINRFQIGGKAQSQFLRLGS